MQTERDDDRKADLQCSPLTCLQGMPAGYIMGKREEGLPFSARGVGDQGDFFHDLICPGVGAGGWGIV